MTHSRNARSIIPEIFVGCVIALVILLGFGGCVHVVMHGVYADFSTGQRTGLAYKISHKGLIYKSYEGTLNLGGMVPGGENGALVLNLWNFSVVDPEVARQIEEAAAAGKHVTLHYKQWLVKPVSVDTGYVVDSVEIAP